MKLSLLLGRALLALSLAVILTYGTTVERASAVTEQADVFATVVAPIGIQKVDDLVFGTFSEDGTGGTVVINTDDTRGFTGGVALVAADPFNAAEFNISGDVGQVYTIDVAPDPTVLTRVGFSETMEVSPFVTDPTPTGTLVGGSDVLKVGGTLTVNANQAPGNYEGTFNVTVEYQ